MRVHRLPAQGGQAAARWPGAEVRPLRQVRLAENYRPGLAKPRDKEGIIAALDLLGDLPPLLQGQQIGLLVGRSIGPTQSRPWFVDMRAGGGNLLERGSHHLDLARTVAGEVAAVQAAAGRVRLARSGGEVV